MNLLTVALALSLVESSTTPVQFVAGVRYCEDTAKAIYYLVPSEGAQKDDRSYRVVETLKGEARESFHVTRELMSWMCKSWPPDRPVVLYVMKRRFRDLEVDSVCGPGCEPQWSNYDRTANDVGDWRVTPELAPALRAQPPTARRDFVRAYLAVKAKPTAEGIAALVGAPDLPRRLAGLRLAWSVVRDSPGWEIVVASVVRQISREPLEQGKAHRDRLVQFMLDVDPRAGKPGGREMRPLRAWWPDYAMAMLDLADEGDDYGFIFACKRIGDLGAEPRCHPDPSRPGKLVPDPGETARLRELVRSGAFPARP